eukprot:7886660-Pyramimonas_sp.AAC.1
MILAEELILRVSGRDPIWVVHSLPNENFSNLKIDPLRGRPGFRTTLASAARRTNSSGSYFLM